MISVSTRQIKDRSNFSKQTGELSLTIVFEGSGLPEGSVAFNTNKARTQAMSPTGPGGPAPTSPMSPMPVQQQAYATPMQQQTMQQQPYTSMPMQQQQPVYQTQSPVYQQQPPPQYQQPQVQYQQVRNREREASF